MIFDSCIPQHDCVDLEWVDTLGGVVSINELTDDKLGARSAVFDAETQNDLWRSVRRTTIWPACIVLSDKDTGRDRDYHTTSDNGMISFGKLRRSQHS